jgi:GNAT superfamily N-acetyltransferase
VEIFTAAERPDLEGRVDSLAVWPEYNTHGDVLNRYWGRMIDEWPEFQYFLVDDGEVLAEGHSLPLAWDGSVDGLPAGIDGAIERAFSAEPATALCAMAIEILPANQSRGLAVPMLEAMAELGRRHGLRDLLAPLRPSWKERYPLVPIERYAAWRRDDGLLFDPWMRVHERLGADVLKPEPRSLLITGAVAEWEAWVGMPFPETDEYVFPGGLTTVTIDRESDVGRYWEPNVWMRHDVR